MSFSQFLFTITIFLWECDLVNNLGYSPDDHVKFQDMTSILQRLATGNILQVASCTVQRSLDLPIGGYILYSPAAKLPGLTPSTC